MFAKIQRTALKLWVTALASIVLVQPAAAAHNNLPCSPPDALSKLFELLHSITELAFFAGVGLATLTFIIAGIHLMMPGEDSTRRGKKIAKNGFLGAVLLLSANMITSYLVSQLGSTICG